MKEIRLAEVAVIQVVEFLHVAPLGVKGGNALVLVRLGVPGAKNKSLIHTVHFSAGSPTFLRLALTVWF